MAKPFNATVAGRVNVDLPLTTKQQIKALMVDTNQDARDIIIQAIAAMWHEHHSDPPQRDVFAELDALKAAVERLQS